MSAEMTYEAMMDFAKAWIANWNRRDVAAVLSHFAEDAEFVSPVAAKYVGTSVLRGKAELAAYWQAALARITQLEFTLDHATWDSRRRELNVICTARLNGEAKRACELMTFDAEGRQIRGEALYGASL
jgi:hypothetical protein